MRDPNDRRPFTVAALADHWSCSLESIYALIRKFDRGEPGGLPAFTIGGKLLRIKVEVVEQWEGNGASTSSGGTVLDSSTVKPSSVGEMSAARTESDLVSSARTRVERRL